MINLDHVLINHVRPTLLRGEYLVLDTETTGFDHKHSRIVQVGLLHVTSDAVSTDDAFDVMIQTPYDARTWGAVSIRYDFCEAAQKEGLLTKKLLREIDEQSGSCLNTSCPEHISDRRLKSGKREFQVAYDVHQISAQRTMDVGMDRYEAACRIHSNLAGIVKAGIPIVGHNINADLTFLGLEFARNGLDCPFSMDNVIDTGLLVKAAKIDADVAPSRGLSDAWQAVRNAYSKGVKWSLTSCVEEFDLPGVDTGKQHASAAYDCYVTHLLLKKLMGGTRV